MWQRLGAAALLAGALGVATSAAQQGATGAHPESHGAPATQAAGQMDHDKMMAEMKAADARLEKLNAAMKSAKGDAQIRAMQDLLSELVQNQVSMHAHMSMMHEQMMGQMHQMLPAASPGAPASPQR
jgi:hypothetical protein